MITANSKRKQQPNSGLGLEGLGDLSALLDAPAANNGGPLDLNLDLIDEDPNQPRTKDNPGFSEESLKELADTIRLRGVKTPISVREHYDAPGRYIINHGARRFRSSLRAGKTTIPVFIDNDYIDDDQVIENLHRDGLTAREIADHIGRKLAKGMKKGDIAKGIGKSAAFVTQHVTLLDLPDPIAVVFNAGRTKDVTVVNELVTAYKKNPTEVAAWLADESQELTRVEVKLFREFLDDKLKNEEEDDIIDAIIGSNKVETNNEISDNFSTGTGHVESLQTSISTDNHNDSGLNNDKQVVKEKLTDTKKIKKAIVQVEHDGRPARIILDRRPPSSGWAWLKYEDDGAEFEAALSTVKLTEILEG